MHGVYRAAVRRPGLSAEDSDRLLPVRQGPDAADRRRPGPGIHARSRRLAVAHPTGAGRARHEHYAGARRLEHLRFLTGDPLVTRFCGLARLPTHRTVANWLRQFTQETLAPLVALNRDLVTEALARLDLPGVTIAAFITRYNHEWLIKGVDHAAELRTNRRLCWFDGEVLKHRERSLA